MASEEEREKILAEYKAASEAAIFNEEDDDEVDFDPSDGEFSGDDDSSDDDDDDQEPDPVVLNGSIYLNDEGRIIYSGTWALQSQLNEEDKDILGTKVSHRKHPKFKLKSQRRYHNNSSTTTLQQQPPAMSNNNELFDLERPTLSKLPRPTAEAGDGTAGEPQLPTRRTICFDGFFIQPPVDGSTPEDDDTPQAGSNEKDGTATNNDGKRTSLDQQHHSSPQGKKIKERDIEIFITTTKNNNDNNANSDNVLESVDGLLYHVSGRGYNEYGPFVLDGTYTLPNKPDNGSGSGGTSGSAAKARVKCNKTYGVGGGDAKTTTTRSSGNAVAARGKRSRRHTNDDDDSFDDDFDEKADYGEVNELCEDAGLSIEELRRKYYGGGGGGGDDGNEKDGDDGGGKISAVKRARLEESDDDECGF